jgi:hypothetical protein
MKITYFSFFFSLLLTGFYGGFGVFHLMGLLPAMQDLSDSHLVAFWQAIDRYMGARMPIFGPILLLSVLFTWINLRKQWQTKTFWLVAAALSCILIDLWIAFTIDKPINVLLQTWDVAHPPADLSQYVQKTFTAFKIRCVLMITGFASMLIALFLQISPQPAITRKTGVAYDA